MIDGVLVNQQTGIAVVKKILWMALLFILCVTNLCLAATSNPKKTKAKTPKAVSAPAPEETITAGLDRLLLKNKSQTQGPHIGVFVQSLDSGKILYQYHANRLFTPASVQKLFTASAAISYLKPTYQIPTQLYTDGSIQNGVLNGNLYLKFNGDPTLHSDHIKGLIDYLHTHFNLQQINGRVFIDNFAYDNSASPPGCVWDDLIHYYAAPMNAIIINHNAFSLEIIPSKTVGDPPILKSSLPDGVAHLVNEAHTAGKNESCPFTIESDDQNVYHVKGCLSRRWGQQWRSLAIRNVVPYAQVLVWQFLQKAGIQYSGPITLRATPQKSQLLVANFSPTLDVIVKKLLKQSDNIYTNALFKKLGETYYRSPGSWTTGVYTVRSLLGGRNKVDFTNSALVDGAGLSRYNLLSPVQLTELLNYDYHNPEIKPVLLESLPIAGKDGTLSYRMPGAAYKDRIHAKTGSMKGVVALAGYIFTRHNGPVVFAIMVNNFSGSKRPFISLEDQICESIVDASRSNDG